MRASSGFSYATSYTIRNASIWRQDTTSQKSKKMTETSRLDNLEQGYSSYFKQESSYKI